jgi:hypothetical protein
MSFKVSGDANLAKNAKISFESKAVLIETDDQQITIPLSNEINPSLCQSFPFSQKLEIKLLKSVEK